MQHLTLVGLTGDNAKLVLVSDSGEEFTLDADSRLRAALRGDHARLGQLEIKMESALRPRDIQARIRAGESPEAVAQAAQTTVDRVMRFATPVLAERAHVADRAQRASVRRKAGEGPSRPLGDAVAERLRSRNVDPGTVAWDAWRRDDGRWTLVADYGSGEGSRRAEFLYDAPGRYVLAQDDEARWLVGEQGSRKGPPGRGSARRLAPVEVEEELPLGADAITMVSESDHADAAPAQGEENTLDLGEAASSLRRRPAEERDAEPVGETGDADWIATQASERPAPGAVRRHPVPEAARQEGPEELEEDSREEVAEQPRKQQPPRRATRKTRGRASVPSWDEIMFGGGRRE